MNSAKWMAVWGCIGFLMIVVGAQIAYFEIRDRYVAAANLRSKVSGLESTIMQSQFAVGALGKEVHDLKREVQNLKMELEKERHQAAR